MSGLLHCRVRVCPGKTARTQERSCSGFFPWPGRSGGARPCVERWFFANDIKGWLSGRLGSSTGGWTFLVLPACALATALLLAQVVNTRFRRLTAGLSRASSAAAALGKFVAAALATFAVART